ncbi:MAG: DUF1189 domain-containing protein [Candidatus Moranbacteria bacterium]|jgi:hypothetical protein|nr:DUF1189 domain-containing protein [Candidatus Moranbacteria bacterium]
MEIFSDIKKSIYSPEYYQELENKPLSSSFGYYFKFSVILSVILSIIFSFVAFFAIKTFTKTLIPEILEKYPQELEIKIQNGVASTNVAEPYFIKIPASDKDKVKDKENFLAIDTTSKVGIDDFEKYNTLLLLTKNNLVFEKSNGQVSIQSLDKVGNFTLNKTELAAFFAKASPYIKWIFPFLLLGIFIGLMFFSAFRLIYFLFAALLVWIVASIKKIPLGYSKSYQLTLHLATLPTIITFIPFFTFRFLFSFIIIILAIINLKTKNEITPKLPASTTENAEDSKIVAN